MKNSEPQTALIESLSHDGRGIARINGKTTFIAGALPQENVVFRYLKRHTSYDEGVLESVLNPHEARVPPPCAHFSFCGGCSLQHMDNKMQILQKQKKLQDHLQHFGGIQPEEWLPAVVGTSLAYRHRARLSVRYVDKKKSLLVGFHEKNGRYVADIDSCSILHTRVSHLIEPLKKLITQLHLKTFIPQIEVAVGDAVCALIFRILQTPDQHDQMLLTNFAVENDIHLYLQTKGPDTAKLFWPHNCEEKISYRLPDYNLELEFHPADFAQVNPEINRKMISLALDLLQVSSHDHVLDLYCGFGNFTLPIATKTPHVLGIEGSALMIEKARLNAQHNNLHSVEFVCADLSKGLEISTGTYNHFTKVLLDPPRSGALEICQNLAVLRPETIVYVSCNPATLARDIGELVQNGNYCLKKAGIIDMFPHTSHVESIALLQSYTLC